MNRFCLVPSSTASGSFLVLIALCLAGWACGGKDAPDSGEADSLSQARVDGAGGDSEREPSNLVEGTIDGQSFRTGRMPHTAIDVDRSIPLFGTSRFPLLDGKADTEIALFANVDEGQVNRFCAIQTEAYRDSAEGRFRRAVVDTARVGSDLFYVGYFCFDLAQHARTRPDSDIAGLISLIESKGAHADSFYVGIRMARPLDPQNRSEILLLYGESVRLNGIVCSDQQAASAKLAELRTRGISAFSARPTTPPSP